MSRFLSGLSDEQRIVAKAVGGHGVVIAGPGSGKTATVTAKLAHIFATGALPSPYRAVALTFTNDAAREMRSRLRALGFSEWDRLFCGTYHAFSQYVLRTYARHIGLSEDFELDPSAAVSIANGVEGDHPIFRQGSLGFRIERAKRRGLLPADVPASTDDEESEFREAYGQYQTKMQEKGLLDYGDLILYAVRLCTRCPWVLAQLNNAYRYVVADEFQDTDEQQLAMVVALAKPHASTIVADDDQSIYSWRGAVRENVGKAQNALGAAPFILGTNFRSDEVIVEAARTIIAGDPGHRAKPMAAHSTQRGAIFVEAYGSLAAEAASLCTRIAELTGDGVELPSQQVCVISRARNRVQTLLAQMTKSGIPWFDRDRLKYEDTADTQLTLAVLSMSGPADRGQVLHEMIAAIEGMGVDRERQEDALTVARAIMRSAGSHAWSATMGSAEIGKAIVAAGVLDCVREVAASASDERLRIKNLKVLVDELVREVDGGATLASAVRRFLGLDAVQVLTGHGAKGLEFDVVFVVGLEDDTLPSFHAQRDPAQMAEERRIFYVALTRARQLAHLSYVRALPNRYGKLFSKAPSRFLEAISPEMRSPWPE